MLINRFKWRFIENSSPEKKSTLVFQTCQSWDYGEGIVVELKPSLS